ncbi:MAG: phosphoribosylamine--glycine ligase [Blastocatellia bacterium]|nr:phosphoribosylamine--glycine ligase [Blastocatellia bacterium]
MKVLVLGSGGREHALVWKLSQSSRVSKVYCSPGNAGISQDAECLNVESTSPQSVAELAASLEIDLTIVGPEQPLVAGVVDAFTRRRLRIVGPSKAAATLEGSKVFAKEFMSRHHIPTAAFTVCESPEAAYDIISSGVYSYPVVLKVDGLAAGKGVVIASDIDEAKKTISEFMVEKRFGEAGTKVVIEECLKGREASLLIFSDGKQIIAMPPAQDYKNALDGNQGPNTGGMGSFSTPGLLERNLKEKIMHEIAEPTISGMAADGTVFRGVLFIGLMLTENGPRVLEYNVRFGDPETQVILSRLDTDIVDIFEAIAENDLGSLKVSWSEASAVCVVLASAGYPTTIRTGDIISGIPEAEALANVKVFHAGTKLDSAGNLITAGGRVLNVVARQMTLDAAREQAYRAVEKIKFEGMQYRRDIALR